jgi:hypothetical protein
MRTCDYVFIGLALLFVGALVWKIVTDKKEPFKVSCGGCSDDRAFANAEIDEINENENHYNQSKYNPQVEEDSADVRNQSTPEEVEVYNTGNREFMEMVEEDDDENTKPVTNNTFVADSCLPPSMTEYKDIAFEVYDRKIGQLSKSRGYDQGDKIRGDLFIAPANPTDSYGSSWFKPSNTTGVLNAGALRYIGCSESSGVTNIGNDSCKSSNIDVQYGRL